jgi:hypothetical protein
MVRRVGASRYLAGVAVVIAVVALGLNPALVFAGTQGSCLSSDTSKVLLWENGIGDTGDNNDNLWKCGNDNNLDNDAHSLPGDCKGWLFSSTTWNDCVTSVSVWVPAGWCIGFYKHAGYDGIMALSTIQGPSSGTRINLQNNDELSSFLFYEC